jgi:hypothetical protein
MVQSKIYNTQYENITIISEDESVVREMKWKNGLKTVREYVQGIYIDATKVYMGASGKWMYETSNNSTEYVEDQIGCNNIFRECIK